MAKPVLSDPRFFSEEAAFDYVEGQLWPEGPVCPHCGSTAEKIGRLEGVRSKPSKKNPEGVVQVGLRKCYACRGPAFTVRMGTIFEDSHLPLRMWLQAIHLLCASKKGISTRQLQRMLGCGLKTAWHLGHRIREMMTPANAWPAGWRRQDGRSRRDRHRQFAQDEARSGPQTASHERSEPCRTRWPDPFHGHRPSRHWRSGQPEH